MKKKDYIVTILVIIFVIYISVNINTINSLLTMAVDHVVENEDTRVIVPESWNTTDELNITEGIKSNLSFSNGYVIVDIWDDWPEDHITSVSDARFKKMENGSFKVLNTSYIILGGINVSKEIFTNPLRNTSTIWNHVGVNYVFEKEDCNYSVQVHYFTDTDLNNATYMSEVDDRVSDLIANLNNKHYDAFFSNLYHGYEYVSELRWDIISIFWK